MGVDGPRHDQLGHAQRSSKEKETAIIAQTKEIIEGLGQKMRGWLGPGLTETFETLDLLRDHGVEYVCDWVNDDLPYRMNNGLYPFRIPSS